MSIAVGGGGFLPYFIRAISSTRGLLRRVLCPVEGVFFRYIGRRRRSFECDLTLASLSGTLFFLEWKIVLKGWPFFAASDEIFLRMYSKDGAVDLN